MQEVSVDDKSISFDEDDLIVRVYLSQGELLDDDGVLKFTLAQIKSIFFNKKRHCKLDWQFIYWDIKIKKIKKEYLSDQGDR